MTESDNRINARLRELENKVDVGFATVEQLISAIRQEAAAERSRASMMRWGIAVALCGALSGAADAFLMDSLLH